MKLKLVENSFRRNSKWNDSIDRKATLPKKSSRSGGTILVLHKTDSRSVEEVDVANTTKYIYNNIFSRPSITEVSRKYDNEILFQRAIGWNFDDWYNKNCYNLHVDTIIDDDKIRWVLKYFNTGAKHFDTSWNSYNLEKLFNSYMQEAIQAGLPPLDGDFNDDLHLAFTAGYASVIFAPNMTNGEKEYYKEAEAYGLIYTCPL